jgi:hypothetical protein
MKKFKKLTAGLLGVVMALSVCSFTAFAGEKYVAEIDDKGYESLGAAIEDARGKECTIEILDNIKESGFIAKKEDKFTIDFNGYTYTIDGTVGSPGTETNGMQLLKGSEITLKDGTVKSDTAKILIQNYCDLILMDMNLDGTGENCNYVISNNYGNTKIGGDTNITAKDGKVAFDLYFWPDNGYVDGVTVTFLDNMTGTVKGKIEYTNDKTQDVAEWLKKASLVIENGTFESEIYIGAGKDDVTVDADTIRDNSSIKITSGSFTSDVSDYMDSESTLVKDKDGKYVVMDKDEIKESTTKFYIDDYDDLKTAIAHQTDGVTWILEKGTYKTNASIVINKDVTIVGNGSTISVVSKLDGEGSVNGSKGAIEINSGADVKIEDLTVEGNKNVKHVVNVYTGEGQKTTTVELDNVILKGATNYGVVNNASSVTLTNVVTSGNTWGINVDNMPDASTEGATLIINKGTVINEEASVWIENANNKKINAKITGGEFAGTVAIGDPGATLEITGGDFEGTVGTVAGSDINIVSGTFATDIRDYIDDGSEFIKDKDGNYVVMDEIDSKRPSHSYSLEEGRVDRDDEDKEEPVVTTEPEEEAGPFSDVGKDNPNYDAIIKVYENGWMAGIGDGVFAPNGTLTRGMGAMVLWNKAGCPEPQNVAPFLDVTSDDWYAKAVAWAYEQGIVAGYGDVFGPDDALTTEQFERMSAIANGKTPEIYVGGAPNATRGWVASLLAM